MGFKRSSDKMQKLLCNSGRKAEEVGMATIKRWDPLVEEDNDEAEDDNSMNLSG